MKTWYNVKKEDLFTELCPGVTSYNGELAHKMNWIEYLDCLKDLVYFGLNKNDEVAQKEIERMLGNVYRQAVHVVEDRWPEPEEVKAYKTIPYTRLAVSYLVGLAEEHTVESWTEYERDVRQNLGIE